MGFGIYSAIAGANARSTELEVLANNLANIQTNGYKEQQISFTSELDSLDQVEGAAKLQAPVRVGQTHINFSQGSLYSTESALDVALQGDGFFEVQTPQGTRYTRSGNFTINQEGQLVTQAGDPVMTDNGPLTLPQNETINVGPSGEINTSQSGNIGNLKIVDFADKSKLTLEGHTYYSAEGLETVPSKNFRIAQYHLESSNVDLVLSMTRIIEVSRAYESHQKSLNKQIEASTQLNQLAKLG